MKNCKKVLIESKLFNRIKETEINDMMKCLSPIKKEYEKNEYIYRYGENIKFMGFVVQLETVPLGIRILLLSIVLRVV